MRPATVASLVLGFTLVLSPLAKSSPIDGTENRARAPRSAPDAQKKADAGHARRRAVRKTTPLGPTAKADAYAVARGGTLVVDATTGVLANDLEPQSKPLTASLVTGTTHGTLTFAANGSFTYVHDNSLASDSFTYKASNGTVETAPATVTISVAVPATPMLSVRTRCSPSRCRACSATTR
jgi:VCBS repeat-containing protein